MSLSDRAETEARPRFEQSMARSVWGAAMTRFFRLLLPAVLATLMLSASADAQAPAGAPCADRAKVVEHLRELYGGQGRAAGGTVIELFVGVGGSFTLFATTPQGLSCLIATGEAWEPSPQPEHFAVR